MNTKYGNIREEDVPVLEKVLELFEKNGLKAGLHGTSLWNKSYKDIDLLAVSFKETGGVDDFLRVVETLENELGAQVGEMRGNELIGLDCDLEIGPTIFHLSYVILLV